MHETPDLGTETSSTVGVAIEDIPSPRIRSIQSGQATSLSRSISRNELPLEQRGCSRGASYGSQSAPFKTLWSSHLTLKLSSGRCAQTDVNHPSRRGGPKSSGRRFCRRPLRPGSSEEKPIRFVNSKLTVAGYFPVAAEV